MFSWKLWVFYFDLSTIKIELSKFIEIYWNFSVFVTWYAFLCWSYSFWIPWISTRVGPKFQFVFSYFTFSFCNVALTFVQLIPKTNRNKIGLSSKLHKNRFDFTKEIQQFHSEKKKQINKINLHCNNRLFISLFGMFFCKVAVRKCVVPHFFAYFRIENVSNLQICFQIRKKIYTLWKDKRKMCYVHIIIIIIEFFIISSHKMWQVTTIRLFLFQFIELCDCLLHNLIFTYAEKCADQKKNNIYLLLMRC